MRANVQAAEQKVIDNLATRYNSSLVEMRRDVQAAEQKVIQDLARLGIVW